jgi:putative FmdB family regulatory protein
MTYEYECTSCKHVWEKEQKITESAVKICPKCNKETAKRLISGGTGFQLKGSGWFNSGGY